MPTSRLTVYVYDGTRRLLTGRPILFYIRDGFGRMLVQQKEFPSGQSFDVPFHDNLGDNHTVVVHADGYGTTGFMPVHCAPELPQRLDLMLLPDNPGFTFRPWDEIAASQPLIYGLLTHGAADAAAARDRLDTLKEDSAPALACLLNITTAMAAINLAVDTPLHYFKELIWDETMKEDRFFAWADPALYQQVRLAAQRGLFAPEPGFALFHQGATDSYKQLQFGEANVQLTFHGNDKQPIDGVECIRMECDIDYYKDELAHALLEVVVNGISNSLTDPKQVYMLRWIAGRHAGVSPFEPPYVIE
jgi:hypothetical protein